MTKFLLAALVTLLTCLTLSLVGCNNRGGASPTSSPMSTSTQTPSRSFSPTTFAITDPQKGSEVDRNIITVKGVGAKSGDSIVMEVLTNQWWLQDGKYDIDPDGSWTYGPCYLMGKGAFRLHHTVKAKLMRGGNVVATSIIDEVKAPEPKSD